MKNTENPVISTRCLTKKYNGIEVLKSLDLEVGRNSIFGFLGPNGAGKSTTIRLLLGLIRPASGSGSIFGLDIVKESADIRRRIGYLPQNPRFYDYMTAREVLRFTAGFFYDRRDSVIEKRVDEMLEIAGLQSISGRPVKGFSGGELQRLGIAQAQVNSPELLILDEPAASLDPMGRRDVLDVMRSLKGKTTIFYSTHILDDVQRVSDTVGIMNRGELVALAPVDELLSARERVIYDIILEGETDAARSRIEAQPWVSSVDSESRGAVSRWSISATDENSAEKNLLRLILGNENIVIKEFIRRRDELEDVFMRIVGGEGNV